MFVIELCALVILAFIWTVVFAAILLIASVFHLALWILLLPLWLVVLVVALLFNINPLRRRFISERLWQMAKKIMPPMSTTERQALEAGNSWWEAELFRGRPRWQRLHDIKLPKLTSREQAFLDNQVVTLCKMLNDWHIVYERADLPSEIWHYIKKERFFGMAIPQQYGGLGFSSLMQSNVVSMVSTRSLSTAITIMVPNSLGPAELLIHYGNEAQRQQYLPKLATGDDIPCFALTSSYAGSDAAKMQDYGIVCFGDYQGKKVLGMKVTWSKRYITLAPVATLLGLAIKLYDPDHLLGQKEEIGITLCLVPTNYPGVQVGRRHLPVFHAFMNGPTNGQEVFMPLEFIIGGRNNAGKGWQMLMECLSAGRAISLPAVNVGASKLCYRMTGAYAKLREQFGVSIGKFEGIAIRMGEIAGLNYLMEAMRIMTAGGVDLGIKPSLCSAIAKYHSSELGRLVANHTMDIHAGRAIQAGPRNYLLHGFMGIPIGITVEGANILTRNLIIFGQGAIRCHPFAFEEMQAIYATDQKQGLLTFDRLLVKHLSYTIVNIARSFLFGLGFGRLLSTPVKGVTAHFYRKLTRLSIALALSSDIAMALLGGNLKRMENLSARLGDVLSYLYLASATLKYYQDRSRNLEDKAHVSWAVQYCIYHAQEALMGFFANFPKRLVGRLLRFVIFPFGRRYHPPADKLSRQLADIMMKPSAFRDRMSEYCYIGDNSKDPTGRVELAFRRMITMEPLLKKLYQAEKRGIISRQLNTEEKLRQALNKGVFDQQAFEQMREFEAMRLDAMEVDCFPADYIHNHKE